MTRIGPRRAGITLLVGVGLSACGGDDPEAYVATQEPTAGTIGSLTGGAMAAPPTGGTPFPGVMPPPPDDPVPGPPDDSMQPPPDDSMQPPPDDPGAASTPPTGSGDISGCAPPPEGASATAVEAWTLVNEIRLAAGSGCMNMVPELNASAQAHCDYRAMNNADPACRADAHSEIRGCPGFTGADVQSREIAAGYPRQLAYTEVALTYGDNPALALPGWLVTPYHRIPLIDPWTTDMGWGGGPGCDIIDLGRGTAHPPDDTIVVYPYEGQIDVPPTFNGLEAPAPPQPESGWPSSYPISIYAQQLSITEHVLTKDGDDTPLDHVWLDSQSREVGGLRPYFATTAILYGAPFEPNTTYRVRMAGTHAGGALNVEWTFTTGASRRFGF